MELQAAAAISRLASLSPRQRLALLYRLRRELDEESFRRLAALVAIDLSIGENPRRWRLAEDAYEPVEEPEPLLEGTEEPAEAWEPVEEEYVGRQVVERTWRWST